jgi:hypothetical protein
LEQVIDLVELEEKYGAGLVKELKVDINHAIDNNLFWKIKVIYESKNFIHFACATPSYSQVYEVSKKRKEICEKYIIGKFDCEILNSLMNSFDQA